jgi:hypothetical protein
MVFVIAVVGAVLGAASLLLHALGSKYPKAEVYAEDVDKVKELVPEK